MKHMHNDMIAAVGAATHESLKIAGRRNGDDPEATRRPT